MDAMIINPDLESRMRLRQAMSLVPEFRTVRIISTLTEALQRLFGGGIFGSFFISTIFGRDVVREFIHKSKETEGGREAAYIFTLVEEARTAELAQDLVHGADGFLVEPYSVESLQKIHTLALQVKSQRVLTRQKAAIRMFIQEAIEGIDEWAWDSYESSDLLLPTRLEKVKRTIRAFPETSQAVYYEVLQEVFAEIERPRELLYRGSSRRLRKKLAESPREKSAGPVWRILRKG